MTKKHEDEQVRGFPPPPKIPSGAHGAKAAHDAGLLDESNSSPEERRHLAGTKAKPDTYEMTREELGQLLQQCDGKPYAHLDAAGWAVLGLKYGFDPATVKNVAELGRAIFTAEPTSK